VRAAASAAKVAEVFIECGGAASRLRFAPISPRMEEVRQEGGGDRQSVCIRPQVDMTRIDEGHAMDPVGDRKPSAGVDCRGQLLRFQ